MAAMLSICGVIYVMVGFLAIAASDEKKLLFNLAKAFLASVEWWHAFLFCIIDKKTRSLRYEIANLQHRSEACN
jgi:hypothetical protein